MKKYFIVIIALWLQANLVFAQTDHWESVVLPGDLYRYTVPQNEINNWNQPGFDDSAWPTGNSGFGYGDNDDATILGTTHVAYIRKNFEIVSINDVDAVVLDMDFDDGFVAYINGAEVARFLVSGDNPAFDQASDGLHEANLYRGLDPERFFIDKNLLKEGINTVAISIHNESLSSSDMTGIPTLSLGIISTAENYRSTPDWFNIPNILDFTSSNLPIVIIETENAMNIQDDPRVGATMWILAREDGQRNLIEDQNNPDFQNYKGRIEIEIRGSSSQELPKKQFGFTTYNNGGNKEDISLLDMPKENDWILNGLAFDPSLIRDYLTYNLYRQMGNYTTRTRFCEVMINGDYKGLYVLQERLKADKNRIDINKIDADDNALPQLSGGYVTKADKTNGDPVAFSMPNYGGWETEFIHATPDPDEATFAQTDYIQNVFYSLESTSGTNNSSKYTGFPSIIDMPSFIDYILISELSANVDAYQFSTYFHKDRNGKLRAGPIWDCNLTYGNDLFDWGFDRSKTDVWQFFDGNMGAKFWKDLFDNDMFRCYLSRRWSTLRSNGHALSDVNITSFIDNSVDEIFEAVGREEARWGTVGDHPSNIEDIKAFIRTRAEWMSSRLGSFSSCSAVPVPELKITAINYHPESMEEIDDSDLEFIRLTNTGTTSIDLTGVYFGGTGLVYQFPNNTSLDAGQHIFLANETQAFISFYGFNPFDEFSRSLDNSGQTIRILDAFGNEIDAVTYDDKLPWPEEADGGGSHLELIDINTNNDLPENWKAAILDKQVLFSGNGLVPFLRLYPNPTADMLTISCQNIIKSIILYDNQGRQISNIEVDKSSTSIDMTTLSRGIYYLDINLSHGVISRKVIHE